MKFNELLSSKFLHIPYDFHYNAFGFKNTSGSDISAHLPLLKYFASLCNHVTEFGTRNCYSTVAFLDGCKGKVVSYDIQITKDIELLKIMELPCQWEFKLQSTIDPNHIIEETDLLLVDTLHEYNQVKKELKIHAQQVKKYIVFHDTFSFPEIIQAINEFLKENNWKIIYDVAFNHGLVIIEKQ